MIGNKVFVITSPQDGWDCVKGVFVSEEGVEGFFKERGFTGKDDPEVQGEYVVHNKTLRG